MFGKLLTYYLRNMDMVPLHADDKVFALEMHPVKQDNELGTYKGPIIYIILIAALLTQTMPQVEGLKILRSCAPLALAPESAT